jgi:hypothetical protein
MPIYRQPSGPQYAPTLSGEEFRQQTGGLAQSLGGIAETVGGIKEKRGKEKERERKQALAIAKQLNELNQESGGRLFRETPGLETKAIKAYNKGMGSEVLPSGISLGPSQTPLEAMLKGETDIPEGYETEYGPQGKKSLAKTPEKPIRTKEGYKKVNGTWKIGYYQNDKFTPLRDAAPREIQKDIKVKQPKLMKGPSGEMVEKKKGAEYYKKPEISPTEKRMRVKELRDAEAKVLLHSENMAVRPIADFFNANSNKNYFLVPITTEEWGADPTKFEKFTLPKEAKNLGWTATLIRKKAKEENITVIDALRKWKLLEQ